jgi:ATP-binding cassette, subfamily C (CFTR/MRP), member 4
MEKKSERAHFGYDDSSFFKDIFMTWYMPLLNYFRANPPTIDNTIEIPKRLNYPETLKLVKEAWKKEKKNKEPNYFNAIWVVMKREIVLAFLPGALCYNFHILTSLMIYYIIRYINNTDEPASHIAGYIIAYSCLLFTNFLFTNYSWIKGSFLVAKVKGITAQMIYSKVVNTYYGEISQGDQSGKITSLISSDLEFFDQVPVLTIFFCLPLFLSGSAVLLWFNLGVSGIVGLIVAAIHMPIIYIFGKKTGKYRFLAAAIGDSRMKMTANLIEGIKIVKLYGWESPYLEGIFSKRKGEIEKMKQKSFITSLSKTINYGSMGLVLFVTFSMYISLGNTINPASSSSSFAILMLCTQSINLVGTFGITQIFLIIIAMKRFTQCLLLKKTLKPEYKTSSSYSLKLTNCSFSWKEPETTAKDSTELDAIKAKRSWELKDVNMKCKTGELIMVIGAVGSGKTALFLGILNEICRTEGKISKNGNFSFASEEPWIVSGTIRENILMGNEMDTTWYNMVTNACCLEKDFKQFKEYRDETVVGDRGITLSGGQKARVSLARAIYSNRDIVLLDDPLSAVDPEVCSSLFTNCMKNLLNDKTVILATHQTHFASQASKILILEDGKQLFFGTYEELVDRGFMNFLGKISQNDDEEPKPRIHAQEAPSEFQEAIKDKKSIIDEEMLKGGASFKIYMSYFIMGFKFWAWFGTIILIQIIAQASYLSILIWLIIWGRMSDQTNPMNILCMAILVIILYFLTFFRTYTILQAFISANELLHNFALKGITYTHSVFFDKNPTGRMLNRFAKDTSQVDEILLGYLLESIISMTLIVGNFIVIIVICPYILIPLFFGMVYIFALMKAYSGTNKSLRKVELVTKSPILSTLNTTIHGLATIRCLGLKKNFKEEMKNSVETNMSAYVTYQISQRALGFYLELAPNFLGILNIIALILLKDSLQKGYQGISIALSITMMGYLGYFFRNLMDTDNLMASVQRLFEYKNLPKEGNLVEDDLFKITQGKIEVRELYMKYRDNYDYALKNLNFTIQAGMKTGIIGRTGAGKSSIMQVLFRLVNPDKGLVLIDGQDYMKAGLHEIRRQMSVIPQSATLFIASLKDNLDPFHEHTDQDIIKVINKVRLGTLLSQLPEGLNSQINSKGLSLSAGQKQLVCLARAILRKNKIVMIDEATANVDSETDEFIQAQLMKRFKHSTLIIIAHRLRTVIESDWMIIMDKGATKEEGSPRDLVLNKESTLLEMINHTGPEESQYLLSKLAQ